MTHDNGRQRAKAKVRDDLQAWATRAARTYQTHGVDNSQASLDMVGELFGMLTLGLLATHVPLDVAIQILKDTYGTQQEHSDRAVIINMEIHSIEKLN